LAEALARAGLHQQAEAVARQAEEVARSIICNSGHVSAGELPSTLKRPVSTDAEKLADEDQGQGQADR
jgi:hypothetical protein